MQYKLRPIAAIQVHLLVTLFALALTGITHAGDVKTVTVFKAGDEGVRTFRIPVIVRAHNGDLLAFAEARKKSAADHGDIDIVLKRSRDNGETWGPMELVQDEYEHPTAKIWIGN